MATVIMVEADAGTTDANLNGIGNTSGDWVTGTPYPICNPPGGAALTTFKTNYDISMYPVGYLICPDKTTTQVTQYTSAQLYSKMMLKCPPTTVALDAGISNIVSPNGTLCATTVSPVVTINNWGITTLTSCTINYKVDAGTVQTYSWSGSLTTGQTANVTLSNITTTVGTHTFSSYTSNPNGGTDGNANNNQSVSNFTITLGDVGISAIVFPSGTIYTTTITPVVTLHNWGTTTLTSCFIDSELDGNMVPSYHWTGSLATGQISNVTLSNIYTTLGSHTFTSSTSYVSGGDCDATNDQSVSNFIVSNPGATLDAGISAIVSPNGTICTTSISPVVTISNMGVTTLTSCAIKYKVDAGTVQTYSWSGALTTGQTANVTLPNMSVTAGAHTFTSYTSSPNGGTDGNATNDQSVSNFTVSSLPASAGTISGITTVCQGQNSVTYTVPPIANATSYVWTLPTGASGTSTTNSITVNYSTSAASGNITVKGHNSCGDGAVSTLPIVVNPKPATPVITLNGNVLHSNATSGNQWYNQNGLINGATSQNYTVTTNGNYHVIVTVNGCSSNASNSINVVLQGIELYENNKTIIVYPNPVLNELIIEIEGNQVRLNYDILNFLGQVVYTGNLLEKAVVQTADFSPGVYLIKFENGKTFEFKKIVKE